MRAALSLNMTKLLTLLLVIMPFLLAIEAHSSSQGGLAYHQNPYQSRMIRQRRIEARSFMSWLTHISSKASDWLFGSVPNPAHDDSHIPKPAVGGVTVLPKMPYPFATGIIPRLASDTLSGGGLPGGWMCLHVTPPVENQATGSGAGAGAGAGAGGRFGGQQMPAGGDPGTGPGGYPDQQQGGGGAGGGGGYYGSGYVDQQKPIGGARGYTDGSGAVYGGYAGQQQGAGTGPGYYGGGAGAGSMGMGGDTGGMGGGGAGMGGAAGGMGGGAGTGAGGMRGGGGGYVGSGGDLYGGAGTGTGFASGGSGDRSTGGAEGAYPGSGSGPVPAGYIRYQGQLMTIDQYTQALANSGASPNPSNPYSSSPSLNRRDLLRPDSSELSLDASLHKRQLPDSPPDGTDESTTPKKKPAKVLMCINGDPAIPPIKFNTMTGLRIRDASAQQDGVVEITNLPNYQMPWMPFLPTEEMWSEQQTLMLAQEDMIEKNMTTAPPPSR